MKITNRRLRRVIREALAQELVGPTEVRGKNITVGRGGRGWWLKGEGVEWGPDHPAWGGGDALWAALMDASNSFSVDEEDYGVFADWASIPVNKTTGAPAVRPKDWPLKRQFAQYADKVRVIPSPNMDPMGPNAQYAQEEWAHVAEG